MELFLLGYLALSGSIAKWTRCGRTIVMETTVLTGLGNAGDEALPSSPVGEGFVLQFLGEFCAAEVPRCDGIRHADAKSHVGVIVQIAARIVAYGV